MPESHPDYVNSTSDVGLRVFGGTSNPLLLKEIAGSLGISPGRANIDHFPDGETIIKLEDDVRGRDCFVVQSTSPPVNENLMELLIFIDSLRRASARRITAVIPYFGYARQDRKAEGRTPITAKLVANLISEAGAHRVLTMDLHAQQIQGFFDLPVDHLSAMPVIAEHVADMGLKDCAIVSPDVGNLKQATSYAQQLGYDIAVIDKRRVSGSEATASRVIGDVKGKDVLIFDDMIATGGTSTEAIRILRQHGARKFMIAATHGLFAGPAVKRMKEAVLSVADLLGEAIRRIHLDLSISAMFHTQGR